MSRHPLPPETMQRFRQFYADTGGTWGPILGPVFDLIGQKEREPGALKDAINAVLAAETPDDAEGFMPEAKYLASAMTSMDIKTLELLAREAAKPGQKIVKPDGFTQEQVNDFCVRLRLPSSGNPWLDTAIMEARRIDVDQAEQTALRCTRAQLKESMRMRADLEKAAAEQGQKIETAPAGLNIARA